MDEKYRATIAQLLLRLWRDIDLGFSLMRMQVWTLIPSVLEPS